MAHQNDPAPAPVTQVNGIMRACCADDRNLQLLTHTRPELVAGMIVKQCRRCGRKHYELYAEAGALGLTGGKL